MTGFAVIGYGSLIWDLDDLAPYVEGSMDALWRTPATIRVFPRFGQETPWACPGDRPRTWSILSKLHNQQQPSYN